MGYAEGGAAGGFAVGGPVGALVGGIGGGIADFFGAQSANQMNWDMFVSNQVFNQANINAARDYDYNMSNTAVQRRVADLQKAGINPMLAVAGQGAGGGSSQITNAGQGNAMQNPLAGVARSVENAIKAVALEKDLKQADAQIALTNMQAVTEAAKAERETWGARDLMEDVSIKAKTRQFLDYETGARKAEGHARENKAALDIKYGNTERLMSLIRQGSSAVSNAVDAATSIIPSKGAAKALGRGRWTPARLGDNVILQEIP